MYHYQLTIFELFYLFVCYSFYPLFTLFLPSFTLDFELWHASPVVAYEFTAKEATKKDSCKVICSGVTKMWENHAYFEPFCEFMCELQKDKIDNDKKFNVEWPLPCNVIAEDSNHSGLFENSKVYNASYCFCDGLVQIAHPYGAKCLEGILEHFPSSFRSLISLGFISMSAREFSYTETLALQAEALINKWSLNGNHFSSNEKLVYAADLEFINEKRIETYYLLTLSYTESGSYEKALPLASKWLFDDQSVLPSFFYSTYRSAQELCNFALLKKLDTFGDEVIKSYISEAGSFVHPFTMLSWPFLSAESAFTIVSNVGQRYKRNCLFHSHLGTVPYNPSSDKRIRVGFLSPDLHSNHPVGILFHSFFKFTDTSKFHLFCYSLLEVRGDPYQDKFAKECESFVQVGNDSDFDLYSKIKNDKLDVLVDLVGYCLRHRASVLCGQPARIQVNFLGFSYSLGAQYMQYIVTDSYTTPLHLSHLYTEKFLRFPVSMTYFLNSHRYISDFVKAISRTENLHLSGSDLNSMRLLFNLPVNATLLGCFSASYKIAPLLSVWFSAMKEIKNTILVLREPKLNITKNNILKLAGDSGLSASRIFFAERLANLSDHLVRLSLMDVYLDSFPYNSHSVAIDVLFAGLPMVTLYGKLYSSRVGLSLVSASNCGTISLESNLLSLRYLKAYNISTSIADFHLAVHSENLYYLNLLELLENQALRIKLRRCLEVNRWNSTLFDTQNYVRHWENGLSSIVSNFTDSYSHVDIPLQSISSPYGTSESITLSNDQHGSIRIFHTETPTNFSFESNEPNHFAFEPVFTPPNFLLPEDAYNSKCISLTATSILPEDVKVPLPGSGFYWAQNKNGSIYHINVDPFINANTFRSSSDVFFDLREIGHSDWNSWCKLARIKQQEVGNRSLRIFIRTEYLWVYLTEIDPFCFDLEPTLLIGDSDISVPSMMLATSSIHTDNLELRRNIFDAEPLKTAEHYLKKRNKFVFISNYDGPFIKTVRPIPLGLTSGHWVSKQIFSYCYALLERQKLESTFTFRRSKILHVRVKLKNNYIERLQVSKLVGRLRTQYSNFESLATFSTGFQNHSEYLVDLRSHLFVISPSGRGLDTHRTYEALLMGCIPIVKSRHINSGGISAYEGLPVLYVNSWQDIDFAFLLREYERMSKLKWEWERLFSDYWRNLVEKS